LYWFKLHRVYHLYSDHWDDLSRYPKSTSLQDGNIHDVWNGDAVKPLIQKGCFLDYPEHLALSLSTDGVPVFKSSGATLWPVYLTIENLPPRIRFKNENTITCGLWFGPKKPAMNLLLLPVVKMLRSLYTIGISMAVPSGIKTIRAKLLNGVFDLVAKAPVINMKRFNGEYGCSTCIHPGSHSHGCHVYLPNIEPIPTARTHTSC